MKAISILIALCCCLAISNCAAISKENLNSDLANLREKRNLDEAYDDYGDYPEKDVAEADESEDEVEENQSSALLPGKVESGPETLLHNSPDEENQEGSGDEAPHSLPDKEQPVVPLPSEEESAPPKPAGNVPGSPLAAEEPSSSSGEGDEQLPDEEYPPSPEVPVVAPSAQKEQQEIQGGSKPAVALDSVSGGQRNPLRGNTSAVRPVRPGANAARGNQGSASRGGVRQGRRRRIRGNTKPAASAGRARPAAQRTLQQQALRNRITG